MYDRISGLARIGVWEFDLETETLTWTDAVYDLFDLPRGSPIVREQILKLYDPASREEMEALRGRAIADGTGFSLDIRIRTGRGQPRWIRLTADVEQENGRSVRIFGTKQDISAERAAQKKVEALQTELIHASRVTAMGAMASTLAHEVNQPLAAASNYLAAARRMAARGQIDPELANSIGDALNSTMRAGEIIRRVREMIGRGHPLAAQVEIAPVVKEAIALARAGAPDASITCDLPAGLSARGDRIQVQQVLINLIRNACEAVAGDDVRIHISAVKAVSDLEICVSDSGPGISASILPDVFESFVTTKPDGLGIGLSISRTIVEAHGGRVRAENRPEGGASVFFTLPLWPGDLPGYSI